MTRCGRELAWLGQLWTPGSTLKGCRCVSVGSEGGRALWDVTTIAVSCDSYSGSLEISSCNDSAQLHTWPIHQAITFSHRKYVCSCSPHIASLLMAVVCSTQQYVNTLLNWYQADRPDTCVHMCIGTHMKHWYACSPCFVRADCLAVWLINDNSLLAIS